MLKTKVNTGKPKPQRPFTRVTTLATNVQADTNLPKYNNSNTTHKENSDSAVKGGCSMCKLMNHKIENCFKFKKLNMVEKLDIVKDNKLCFSCLKTGHFSKDCKSQCDKCKRRHHTLLHDNERQPTRQKEHSGSSSEVVEAHSINTQQTSKVCLSIIPVKILGKNTSIESIRFA